MKLITAFFKNHEPVTFPHDTIYLLRTDPNVTDIIDAETGEVIFSR